MKNIEILMPPTKSIMLFNSWCQGLFNKQISMQEENQALARLRDTLLPELMLGRIRVPEAQEAIQDATNNQSDFDKFAAKALEARDGHDDTE